MQTYQIGHGKHLNYDKRWFACRNNVNIRWNWTRLQFIVINSLFQHLFFLSLSFRVFFFIPRNEMMYIWFHMLLHNTVLYTYYIVLSSQKFSGPVNKYRIPTFEAIKNSYFRLKMLEHLLLFVLNTLPEMSCISSACTTILAFTILTWVRFKLAVFATVTWNWRIVCC